MPRVMILQKLIFGKMSYSNSFFYIARSERYFLAREGII
jgi:hypothetical protein